MDFSLRANLIWRVNTAETVPGRVGLLKVTILLILFCRVRSRTDDDGDHDTEFRLRYPVRCAHFPVIVVQIDEVVIPHLPENAEGYDGQNKADCQSLGLWYR